MRNEPLTRDTTSEHGSALVIALLVTFILTLLGVSFLLMAQTETRIARNETRSTQVLYLAEAGAQAVQGWFDRPGTALGFPDPAVVRRSLREVLDESDPYQGAPIVGAAQYKQNSADSTDVDLDGDGLADLFRRPYRGGVDVEHALMGREGAPDMRIDDQDADDAVRTYLTDLSATLFGTSLDSVGRVARISRIDIYAPPYVAEGGNWSRYGVGTVRVTARVYRLDPAGNEAAVLAEHSVKTVLNEIPYVTPVYGPLHSCGDLTFSGPLSVHWGPVTAAGDIVGNPETVPAIVPSLPRTAPPGPRLDRLWVTVPEQADCLLEYTSRVEATGDPVDDPWLRVVARGAIDGALPGDDQPFEPLIGLPDTIGVFPVRDATHPCIPGSTSTLACCDKSNLFQHHPLVGCPEYDYEYWKNIAQSGRSDVHYYVPDGLGGFQEGGVGDSAPFEDITDGRTGLFFFDTSDQLAPHDDDLDGLPNNPSPAITVSGNWQAAGFIFLNASSLTFNGPLTPPLGVVLRAPGEPFLDEDANRRFDDGEAWINLVYPNTLDGAFNVNAVDNTTDDGGANPGGPVRNAIGPVPITAPVSFYGILYTSGSFSASGTGTFYGSVIARGDVSLGAAGVAPDFYWDNRISNEWPPADLALPRVTATRWTDAP